MNLFIIVGAIIGFIFNRFTGAILGAFVGWWISKALRNRVVSAAQSRFVDSTFAVMGAVCKVDGRVSEREIQLAEDLFEKLRLSPDARASARDAFRRGKRPGFDLDAEVADFARACRNNKAFCTMFLQIQLGAVAADGEVSDAEHQILVRIARGLGLSEAEVERLEATLRVHGDHSQKKLDDAYQVLGLPADASDAELKRAYRKLMSENHPDKLASRGLPESVRQMAEEKTRDITAAYDLIKEARGLP